MQIIRIAPSRSQPVAARVVLMPGAYHTADQFLHAGFDQAVHARGLPIELILATPQLTHLTDRRWIQALHEEIMLPGRSQPQLPLWLGGVSLGGFMALRYAAQYPSGFTGLCLLAPYLGSRIIAAEVAAHADMAAWQAGVLDDDDDERRIWHYITRMGSSLSSTRVFLGFGAGDRFADTQQMLAHALRPARPTTRVIDGGHDWLIWRALWEQFLDADMVSPPNMVSP
jgi:pimeloyl-ACP methyl ester carboxylesterase